MMDPSRIPSRFKSFPIPYRRPALCHSILDPASGGGKAFVELEYCISEHVPWNGSNIWHSTYARVTGLCESFDVFRRFSSYRVVEEATVQPVVPLSLRLTSIL